MVYVYLASHILEWICSEGCDEITIINEVSEATLNGVVVL